MPTTYHTQDTAAVAVSVAEVEAKLRRGVFVKRGDIVRAFGLTRSAADALIPGVFKPVPLPGLSRPSKRTGQPTTPRCRFLRADVIAIARSWERGRAAA
jgi:hypothetical protein